ncbi:hypothetical protein ACHAWX_006502 [Stephanocyclus meneghinianus]
MRFAIPTTTIASIYGASCQVGAILTSVSRAHAHQPARDSLSVPSPANATGNECSIVNSFGFQVTEVDTGILGCGAHDICVEDPTSTMGGRCIALDEAGDSTNESPHGLIACTFKNGTSGQKCVGEFACTGADQALIGCGSCIGRLSCFLVNAGVTIGENSCVGVRACSPLYQTSSIGDNSCNESFACAYLTGKVGNNSCTGGTKEVYIGYEGHECYYFMGSIGDSSCVYYSACSRYENEHTASIGSNSCNGVFSCDVQGSRSTGDKSCNGYQACDYVYTDVGYNSCNGNFSCYNVSHYTSIGDCLW